MIGSKHDTNLPASPKLQRGERIHTNDTNKNLCGRICVDEVQRTEARYSCAGFTLIELIVAMAVFSMVITIVSSIFVSTVGSQRKNINNQEVLENARYVLEVMGRAIRQSTIQTANGTVDSLDIIHPTKDLITYQLDAGQIKETSGGITDVLTSSEVLVDELSFIVQGNGLGTKPRVTIIISLNNAQPSANSNSIKLQTTITPRN